MRLGYRELPTVSKHISWASMRPRRMRLGYLTRMRLSDAGDHGFNEAEAHAPRIPVAAEPGGYGPDWLQ